MANKVAFLQGNEAAAHGALYAGCKFFAGYPITPSTEVAEVMSVELPKIGGKFIQMEDEIGAMAALLGGALTGAKALTSTSGPGLSLKQELIGYGVFRGLMGHVEKQDPGVLLDPDVESKMIWRKMR